MYDGKQQLVYFNVFSITFDISQSGLFVRSYSEATKLPSCWDFSSLSFVNRNKDMRTWKLHKPVLE